MPEPLEKKVRRVYLARKRIYGMAKRRDGWGGDIRNQARLDASKICEVSVAEVKRVLALAKSAETATRV